MRTLLTAPARTSRPSAPHRWLPVLMVALMVLVNVPVLPAPVAAQIASPPCANQGPPDGSFIAEVCFTTPLSDGPPLSGDVNVTVSVSQVSGTMPAVEIVRFYFGKAAASSPPSLLTDFAAPWGLTLPTDHWKDTDAESTPFRYQIAARVKFANGYETTDPATYARVLVDFENGVTSDQHSDESWMPKESAASPLTVVATGDGAGGEAGATDVGNLVAGMNPDLFLYLGDVYNSGKYAEFTNYYGPTLGSLANITNPVPGNHETGDNRAQLTGYMDYWNSTKHYYKFDSGGWHFIALDSNTDYGQFTPGTAQYDDLARDLQANATACTMVFFHHPRFGLVGGGSPHMQDIWALLAQNGVDVVLTGHEHNYQRWKPMDANGQVVTDGTGIRQYIIGTGGHDLHNIPLTDSRVAARVNNTDGALKLRLTPTGGTAQFVGTKGTIFDSSSFTCDDSAPPPSAPPTGDVEFMAAADARVQEANPTTNYGTWTAGDDDDGEDF
jgi:predicted phosphodiesterase